MKKILLTSLLALSSSVYAQDKIRMIKTDADGKREVVLVDSTSDAGASGSFEKDVVVGTPNKKPKLYTYDDIAGPVLPKLNATKETYSTNAGSNLDYLPNDTYYNEQIHWLAPTASFLGFNNILSGVQRLSPLRRPVVGIVDGGFYAHPDLIYADSYSMVSFGDRERGENIFRADSDTAYSDTTAEDFYCGVHGTGVAAVAVATRDNNFGFSGIVDGDLLASRALECGFGYLQDAAESIEWQVGKPVEGVRPAKIKADVINVSLGGEVDHCPDFMQAGITAAKNAGVPVVVAIGNKNIDASDFTPTNCEGVINVAAATREGDLFKTSNYGKLIDIVALGDRVASAMEDPVGVGYWEESSVAAPIVTGVIANAVSELGKLSNAEIKFFLTATATPFAPGQCDDSNRCGAGIMDASAFHNELRDYKNGKVVTLRPALSNTDFCEKEVYATDDNELARLCETYELVMPQHQSNRSDIRFEILAFDKSETMKHDNGELVATSTSPRMLMSSLDMDINDYGVRMCNSERCYGDIAIKINDSTAELPSVCNE